jgi:hypothetical protein
LDNSIRPLSEFHRPNHFWADLKGVPAHINLGFNAWTEDETVYAAITAQLSRIDGIESVSPPVGVLMPVPDTRKWKRTLSRILPDSAIKELDSPEWVVEAHACWKEYVAGLPKQPVGRPMPQRAKSPCPICGRIHECDSKAQAHK